MFNNNYVKCEVSEGIALLTVTNPPMNPLNRAVIDGLKECFNLLEKDDSLRVVIVTGSGDKSFVAGADIKEFPDWVGDVTEEMTIKGQKLFDRIENFKVPVIAAINGYALGGGLELALSCDIRIASVNANMGLPEVTLGIIPGYGGTQRLCRTVSVGHAKKMIYTGESITAKTAFEIGLIQEVLPQNELIDRAFYMARKISCNGPIAVRGAKRAINAERNMTIQQGIDTELQIVKEVHSSSDKFEGVDAFINKRKAVFKNK
ncbi:MAG: enoyl-CoA hydratase-related protein [Sedimentibacter sp.]|uniref:enoyl-CoA hydratase-related protein n=1 Tax=Sedimentibacter sp. TaxID=1960295 RepID=UPI003158CF64